MGYLYSDREEAIMEILEKHKLHFALIDSKNGVILKLTDDEKMLNNYIKEQIINFYNINEKILSYVNMEHLRHKFFNDLDFHYVDYYYSEGMYDRYSNCYYDYLTTILSYALGFRCGKRDDEIVYQQIEEFARKKEVENENKR